MTRRRTSAPGARPTRRLAVAILFVSTALLAAACGSGEPTAPPFETPTGPSSPPAERTAEPGSTPVASGAPATAEPESPVPETAAPATPEPTGEATDEPTGTQPTGAEGCAGTDENRDFYAAVAEAVSWPVYCPALPSGWYVQSGQYRLADGGRMEISYRGPGGAGLLLQEGSFCAAEADCVPPGDEVGTADFGDRSGSLVRIDGGWAVVVDRGRQPSWLVLLTGMGEAAARAIAGDLLRVGD